MKRRGYHEANYDWSWILGSIAGRANGLSMLCLLRHQRNGSTDGRERLQEIIRNKCDTDKTLYDIARFFNRSPAKSDCKLIIIGDCMRGFRTAVPHDVDHFAWLALLTFTPTLVGCVSNLHLSVTHQEILRPHGLVSSNDPPRPWTKPKNCDMAAVAATAETVEAAATAVFNIYELHEAVLLHLDFFDILRVQKVSRAWRSLVSSSHQLKKRLFLAADRGSAIPLIKDPFRPHPITLAPRLKHTFYKVLPLFRNDPDCVMPYLSYFRPDYDRDRDGTMFILGPANDTHALATDITSSMFLTQPPCTTINIRVHGLLGPDLWMVCAVVRDSRGFTLGMVREAFENMLGDVRHAEDGRELLLLMRFMMFKEDDE
jgi:hypothetical protein